MSDDASTTSSPPTSMSSPPDIAGMLVFGKDDPNCGLVILGKSDEVSLHLIENSDPNANLPRLGGCSAVHAAFVFGELHLKLMALLSENEQECVKGGLGVKFASTIEALAGPSR